MKKILIISNNVISATNNNGKTLLSLFSEEKDAQIFQLYFSNEQPTLSNFDYFKISDSDLINLRLKGKKTYGQQYSTEMPSEPQISKKHSSISRLFRELIWSNVCNIPELKEWVLDINPTHIFFVGGDCLFAYKIFNYIFELLSKKPVCSLFITDDYVSKKGIFNPFELLRRNCIKKAIGITLKNVKYFFTISNKMKNYYQLS